MYVANCSPVCGSGSEIRGALICLEDVTELERNRRQPGTANVTADRPAAASPLPDDAADPSTIGRLPPSTLGTSTTPRADSSRPRAADPVRSSLRLEDPGFLEIVAGFVGHLSDKLHEIRTFWEVQDLNQLARLAHWLKGAGGTMGFNQFHAPALHLEWLANNRQLDEIPAVIAQLEDLAARIEIPAIESVIPETDPVSQVD